MNGAQQVLDFLSHVLEQPLNDCVEGKAEKIIRFFAVQASMEHLKVEWSRGTVDDYPRVKIQIPSRLREYLSLAEALFPYAEETDAQFFQGTTSGCLGRFSSLTESLVERDWVPGEGHPSEEDLVCLLLFSRIFPLALRSQRSPVTQGDGAIQLPTRVFQTVALGIRRLNPTTTEATDRTETDRELKLLFCLLECLNAVQCSPERVRAIRGGCAGGERLKIDLLERVEKEIMTACNDRSGRDISS